MGRHSHRKARYYSTPTAPTRAQAKERVDAAILAILEQIGNDDEACNYLSVAVDPAGQEAFCNAIRIYIPEDFPQKKSQDIFQTLLENAGKQNVKPTLSPRLRAALAYRQSQRTLRRFSKRHFIELCRLNMKATDKQAWLAGLPTLTVKHLPKAYPPKDHFVADTLAIRDIHTHFIYERHLTDKRKSRKGMVVLDTSKLQYDIKPSEDAVFVDKEGDFIGCVIRNCCQSHDAIEFVDRTIAETLQLRRNIQREDPGKLSLIGLSAGALSRPVFDWVKNIVSTKSTTSEIEQNNMDSSSSFAFFWNMALSLLPPPPMKDYKKFLKKLGICRMDAAGKIKHDVETGRGDYTIKVGQSDYTFYGEELAPPSGVVGENYSRHMHVEHHPHKYAMSWTTSRKLPPGVSDIGAGGHFYLASHGIRIQAAANSIIVWQPGLLHGTSLHHTDNPERVSSSFYCQRGMSFVTSDCLPGVWKNYKAKDITKEEGLEQLVDHETDVEDGGDGDNSGSMSE